MARKTPFWKRLFGRKKLKVVETTYSQSQPAGVSPVLRKMLFVMVSEGDCVGQDDAIKQLEERGAEIAITSISRAWLNLNSLKMLIKMDTLRKKRGDESMYKRIVFVEKNERYREKAVRCSPMVIAVKSLEEAVEKLDSILFF